jgi:hypothetical protein
LFGLTREFAGFDVGHHHGHAFGDESFRCCKADT